MVTIKDIKDLEIQLRILEGVVKKLKILIDRNWQVQTIIPLTDETITHSIPEAKKQAIIQDAIDKRNAFKQKIDSINWNSLN